MSKASIARQKEREKAHSLETRRTWVKKVLIGTGSLLAGLVGLITYNALKSPTFVEAYENSSKREAWLQSLQSRPYLKKKIATSSDLAMLKAKLDYTPPDGAWAATIADDDRLVGNRTTSTLYVYESCFDPAQERFKKSLGRAIENAIENHELIHADHFYQGIPQFSSYLPKKLENNKDRLLFSTLSEIVCHKEEYDGLNRMKNKDDYINIYQSILYKVDAPNFVILSQLTTNVQILDRAKKEAWFRLPY